MATQTSSEQLTSYLADVHAIEEQALTQMRRAPDLVEGSLAEAFERHLAETEAQEQRVRGRLEAHGGSPGWIKDAAGRAGGLGMVLFARFQPDTPGKLVAHAYAYEHMELAAYELLARVAARAGDEETVAVANEIAAEEREMAARLERHFDDAVSASLDAVGEPAAEHLDKYLADAHAIERQSEEMLKRGAQMAGAEGLATVLREHCAETETQQRRLERRLELRGSSPSALKDAALRLGAFNWGAFFAAQPDTPPKLAGFAFALEHLEIASYELLRRTAERAGDSQTVTECDRTLAEERRAAEQIAAQWDAVLD